MYLEPKLILSLHLALLFVQSYAVQEMTRKNIDILTISSNNSQCPPSEERERVFNEIKTEIQSLLNPEQLYTCDGTPGWKQVVLINMADTSYNCPPGLELTSNYSKRSCGRDNYEPFGCSSTTFSVPGAGSEYSRVCGRIRGYQFGLATAFGPFNVFPNASTIDGHYVDGVSLTHGPDGGRQHIWSFAVGLQKSVKIEFPLVQCPCNGELQIELPPFVGDDYFCESGASINSETSPIFHSNDPLWDGEGCTSTSTCCQFNNPPWFTKNLPNPTTDDIELRLCYSIFGGLSDVPLELVELYVQ